MNETQYDKIIELCKDGGWHCQRQFWELYIRSPHKRRKELAEKGYIFEDRPCPHGHNEKEYRMVKSAIPAPEPTRDVVEYKTKIVPATHANLGTMTRILQGFDKWRKQKAKIEADKLF